jgi:ATP-dependent Clp protease ATP-binding subunit ClpA
MDENENKRPSCSSLNKEIRSLGQWLVDQFKKTSIKTEERLKAWNEFLEKYKDTFVDDGNMWFKKLEKVQKYMNENENKRPSCSSLNKEIRSLGQWLGDQFKKTSIKTGERLKAWNDFLENYGQNIKLERQKKNNKSMKLQQQPKSKQQNTIEYTEKRQQQAKSELSTLHQRYKTLTSQNLRTEFHQNPDLWHQYHEISEENEKSFPEHEIPRNRIITELQQIKTKRTKRVADLGCGKAQIAQHFATDNRFQFFNYDHIT